MRTMSTDFVVIFMIETKYSFITDKKTKIDDFRHIFLWDKYTFGEGNRE